MKMGSIDIKKKILSLQDLDDFVARLQLGKEEAHSVQSLLHTTATAFDSNKAPALELADNESRAELASRIGRTVLGDVDGAWVGPESVGFDERVEVNW